MNNFYESKKYVDKSLNIINDLEELEGQKGKNILVEAKFELFFLKLKLGETNLFQIRENILTLIKDVKNIDFEDYLRFYELLEDKSYLNTAYNQIQEKADAMDEELKEKFLTYPTPKQIIEEYNKVFLN